MRNKWLPLELVCLTNSVNESPGDAAYTEGLGKTEAVVPKLMSDL